MTQLYPNDQLRNITDRFAKLFWGRTDSWGAVHGESVRETVVQKNYFLHLIGKTSLGVYPLLYDGTCLFGAVDIDRDDPGLVLKVREELWNIGFKQTFIERSKSKGYHLWIFFSRPVRAREVRHVLSSAIEKLSIRFEIFPKQDHLRDGEIGNYINLPYFGGLINTPDRRVVVDSKTFSPIPLLDFINQAEHSLVTPEILQAILEELPPMPERPTLDLERPLEIPDVDINKLQVSEKIKRLILGDFKKGDHESIEVIDPATGEPVKYPSRSEADEAIIASLLSKGCGDDEIFGVFESYPTTGKYREKERRRDQYLLKSIENAKRFVHEKREEKVLSFSHSKAPGYRKGQGSVVPVPSAILRDGRIVEMVHDPEKRETRFAVFQNGELRYEKGISLGDKITLVPYSIRNNLLKHKVVLFPSHAEEYGREEDLIREIRGFINTYVDVSPLFEKVASYYVLFSWIYDDFEELPYLRVIGDPGSGKTRFLRTVGQICYKPVFASGASTVSPLFRILDIFNGTLIVDEGDFRLSDEKAEIVKILNNGNAVGFPVLRSETVRGKEFSPRAYNVFGPKIISTRGYFEDKALESRCLTEEMGQRKLRENIPINLTGEYKERALRLRNKLLMFRFRSLGKKKVDSRLVDRSIEPRLNQVFVPLFSVIEDEKAKGEIMMISREYHKQIIADRGTKAEAQVLDVIRELFELRGRGNSPIHVKEITNRFIENHGEDYERRITSKWVGSIIREKLRVKTEKTRGGFVISQSDMDKLMHLFEKYGISSTDGDHGDHGEHGE